MLLSKKIEEKRRKKIEAIITFFVYWLEIFASFWMHVRNRNDSMIELRVSTWPNFAISTYTHTHDEYRTLKKSARKLFFILFSISTFFLRNIEKIQNLRKTAKIQSKNNFRLRLHVSCWKQAKKEKKKLCTKIGIGRDS